MKNLQHHPLSLTIIIVNYNSAALIKAAIESVIQNTKLVSYEIIIVDNSSEGEGRMDILKSFPNVRWIDMGYNAGFARANNAGMKAAHGNTFLLLNPDTIVLDDAVGRCYSRLQEERFVAAGVQLVDAALQPQISGSYFVKGGLNHILPIPFWGNVVRWFGYKSGSKVTCVQEAKPMQ